MNNIIIQKLRGNPTERNWAIKQLVNHKEFNSKLRSYIIKNSGEPDDVKMILSDTIISFTKRVLKDRDFELEKSIVPYLMGIAKFKWLDVLNKKRKSIPTKGLENTVIKSAVDDQNTILIKGEKAAILKEILAVMKTNCKQVIMYWAASYKMKEIAEILGYKSEGVARKKKSECMKELLNYLHNNPNLKQELRS